MWLPVVDLPPDSVLVLVWLSESVDFEAGFELAHRYNGAWYEGQVVDFAPVFGQPERITHWRALPQPPEKASQGLGSN
jgi:hypothetical protein